MGVADAIRIVDPADPEHERKFEAKVVALSNELDLAILKCDLLKAPAIQMVIELPRRATEIQVLGFPLTQEIGRNAKSTKGIMTALPDQAHDNMLLFDIEANLGNSGGPVVNNRGNVIAVITVIYRRRGERYSIGIPTTHAVPFIKQKLPNFDEQNALGLKMEWPDVDENVSKSTVMLITYYNAIDFGLVTAASKTKGQGNYLEDRSYTACNGSGYSPCPRKGCSKRLITVSIPYTQNLGTRRQPVIVKKFRTVKRRCPVCNGRNRAPCPYGR